MDVPSLNVNLISTFVDILTVDFFIFILGLFRIQSHGMGIVKLKSLTTMKYIAIGNLGQIYSTVSSYYWKTAHHYEHCNRV